MIREVKRALGIRFSAKALVRHPGVWLSQTGYGFRSFSDLAAELLERRSASVIQVGANDGAANDPLAGTIDRYCEKVQPALLIEPQADAFARLRARYRDAPNVVCLNAAIDRETGERTLYSVDGEAAAALRKGVTNRIASFDRAHVERLLKRRDRTLPPAVVASAIVSLTVPVTTLARAAAGAGIAQPDILLVDAEGFDGEIVDMALDLGWRPELVQWEHSHLAPSDRRRLARRLAGEGYRLWADHADIWGRRAHPKQRAPPPPSA